MAKRSGAEAIHPGYGFLAENAPFAQACEDAGIVFIGPPASAIEAMGSKTRARELMQAAGVPIVPGTTEPVATVADALRIAKDEIGFPVAVKAAGGGGGKGFRVALTEDELEGAFEGSSREGEKFFSDPTVYLERYLHDPRHVEVQVLADRHGNVIHLGERDCSIQRRHQKVIEESPGARVGRRPGRCASASARSASTRPRPSTTSARARSRGCSPRARAQRARVLLPGDEHARAGRALRDRDDDRRSTSSRRASARPPARSCPTRQEDVELRGHAIECRINAEDASKNFAPAPGQDRRLPRAERPGRARGLGRRRRAAKSRRCMTRWWRS